MLVPMSTYAATTFKEGTKTYTLPELTNTQKQQLQSGIQILNRAFVNHQVNVNLPLQQADSFSVDQRNAMIAYMVRAALKANREEFRNGQYLSGLLCPGMCCGANSTTLVLTFFYNISKAQDDKAWQHAQDLVKQLKISNGPNTGMRQIYDYLRKNFVYDSNLKKHHNDNHGQNSLPRVTAYGAWYVPVNGQHKTNCTGFAQMFYLMCRAKGWNNVYVVRNGVHTHAYNAVIISSGTKYVDANFGASNHTSTYFMVSQSQLNSMDNWHRNTDIYSHLSKSAYLLSLYTPSKSFRERSFLMSNRRTRKAEILFGIAVMGGVVPAIQAVPTYASASVYDGTTTYTLPNLTNSQQHQVQQAISIVNQAMYHHQTTVTFPFTQIGSFSSQDRTNISVYIYLNAICLHPEQLQNGAYMAGNLRSTFDDTQYTSSQWTLRLHYNNTAQQDRLAWQKAQSLVKQLQISSDQNTGMKQIYDYCCSHFDYDYDLQNIMDSYPTKSYPNLTAYGILCLPNHGQSPKTLCTGYAQVFYLLCRAMGWNNVYVARNKSHTHMYNAIKTNQGTFIIDSCFGRTYSNRYFMVPVAMAEQIDANHKGTEI